jgi:hypothetical protein
MRRLLNTSHVVTAVVRGSSQELLRGAAGKWRTLEGTRTFRLRVTDLEGPLGLRRQLELGQAGSL